MNNEPGRVSFFFTLSSTLTVCRFLPESHHAAMLLPYKGVTQRCRALIYCLHKKLHNRLPEFYQFFQ